MKTVKEEAIRAISSLPDSAPIDEIMYRLYVIDKISKGQSALKEGRTITTEELLKEIESW
jgi:predicted transcriptional regulator